MRHDYKFVRMYKKHGDAGRYEMELADLPFLYLGDVATNDLITLDASEDDALKAVYPMLIDPTSGELESLLPFERFSVWMPVEDSVVGGWIITIDYDSTAAMPVAVRVDSVHQRGISVVKTSMYWVDSGPIYNGLCTTPEIYSCRNGDMRMLVDPDARSAEMQGFYENGRFLVRCVRNIFRALYIAREKHLVEVRKSTVITKAKAKALRKAGKAAPKPKESIHYVYLDIPKSTSSGGTGTGTGSSKRGHSRRGHWRELNHDRFSHHPKYGKKIWVRPTWCGPKGWTVGDTIYTLKDLQAIH